MDVTGQRIFYCDHLKMVMLDKENVCGVYKTGRCEVHFNQVKHSNINPGVEAFIAV